MGDEAIHKSLKPINPLGNTLKTCYYSVMKMLSCFLQFIKQHKIIQIFVFPPLLFFSLGYLLYWLVGVMAYTPNFARYVAVNTAVLYFLYKLIAKIIKEKYYCYINDFCIEFYKFMQYLKQFHATHVFVIPPLLFFILTDIVFWLGAFINGAPKDDLEHFSVEITVFAMFFMYLLIQLSSLILSVIIALIIFYKQLKHRRKIRVKSNFLLSNKTYNILYLLHIIAFIVLIMILLICPQNTIYFGHIFLIPFYYIYRWTYY